MERKSKTKQKNLQKNQITTRRDKTYTQKMRGTRPFSPYCCHSAVGDKMTNSYPKVKITQKKDKKANYLPNSKWFRIQKRTRKLQMLKDMIANSRTYDQKMNNKKAEWVKQKLLSVIITNSKCTNLPIVAATNNILSTKKNPLTDNTRQN